MIQLKPMKHGVYFLRVIGAKGASKVSDVCEINVGAKQPDVPPIIDVLEGEKHYCKGYIPLMPTKRKAFYAASEVRHGERLRRLQTFQELPPAFDARDKGWVLPIGNQASCGSCYLYSTVYGTMTQAFVRGGYGKADGSFVMSVQFGMDCHNFGGCGGHPMQSYGNRCPGDLPPRVRTAMRRFRRSRRLCTTSAR